MGVVCVHLRLRLFLSILHHLHHLLLHIFAEGCRRTMVFFSSSIVSDRVLKRKKRKMKKIE
ncbi:hypothetical protein OUZ56_013259 [Daphnia magna]|uniref:Uncharacterized protein n=1 Tax=Daphnia magna TaxID=35525 RepID=A0ABQ9Z5G1_9CRUS|nr:hypothetical protein OUZ56_013259 [Daphnia magna]